MNLEKQAKKFMKSAKSQFGKAKRTYVCRSLKDLIKAYRACTSRSEERALVKKEAAHIRDLFREGDKAFRRRNISKLLFFHMNGYPTDFGMTECIKLCASHKYSDKRVAYLGLMILVDETTEILMLMTNCLQQDLNSSDTQIVSLALNVLGDIASVEMVRDLLPEIEKHLLSPNTFIRKKAALAAVRAVRKLTPEETSTFIDNLPGIFDARSSAVHLSAAALVTELCKQSSSNIPDMRVQVTPILNNILQEHINAKPGRAVVGSNPDTVISGVRNPFLQVKLLSTLRLLNEGWNEGPVLVSVENILTAVVNNTDSVKVTGCAVLYECVRTIVALSANAQLRLLAVSTLGGLLSHPHATVRYIALKELTQVVEVDGPNAVSTIQGFQDKVLSSLKEADPTVKKTALNLLYQVINSSTVTEMIPELLNYMEKCKSREDLEDACRKTFIILDKYAPSEEWQLEVLVKCLRIADTAMPEDLVTSFIAMVSANRALHPHAVRLLYSESNIGKVASTAGSKDVLDVAVSSGKAADEQQSTNGGRKPCLRSMRVLMYVLGEHGEVAPSIGLSVSQVLDAFEYVLKEAENIDADWMQTQGSVINDEKRILGEAALTGLAKFACRAMGDPMSSAPSSGFGNARPQFPALTGGGEDLTGLGGLLALPAPAPKEKPPEAQGLGTDLLASMGLSDTPSTSALVPSGGYLGGGSDVGSSLVTLDGGYNGTGGGDAVITRVRSILTPRTKSTNVEMQKRACEYLALLHCDLASVRARVLSPMPPLDYAGIRQRARQREEMSTAARTAKPSGGTGGGLLLDLFGESEGAGASGAPLALPAAGSDLLALPSTQTALPAVDGGEFDLEALLGGAVPTSAPALPAPTPPALQSPMLSGAAAAVKGEEPMMRNAEPPAILKYAQERESVGIANNEPPKQPAANNGCVLSAVLFESDEVRILTRYSKDNEESGTTRAEAIFSNNCNRGIYNFTFLLAVPKYMKLQLEPASASEIGPGEEGTQAFTLVNSLHGQRHMQLRYKVQYDVEGLNETRQYQGTANGLEGM